MKIREKEVKDQPWIKRLLSERWGAEGQVAVHGEIFDVETLPAIIARKRASPLIRLEPLTRAKLLS